MASGAMGQAARAFYAWGFPIIEIETTDEGLLLVAGGEWQERSALPVADVEAAEAGLQRREGLPVLLFVQRVGSDKRLPVETIERADNGDIHYYV